MSVNSEFSQHPPADGQELTTVDVVVAGAGPAGLAAAIAARDGGASVIVIEANEDIGGHGILSGGNVYLGGGNSLQRELGIDDDPDKVFADWTRADLPETRFNDRDLLKTFAERSVETFDFLEANGVRFIRQPVRFHDRVNLGPGADIRIFRCVEWEVPEEVVAPNRGRNGSGLVRALARSAGGKGAAFLLNHRLERLTRDADGRVTGLTGRRGDGSPFAIEARRGVVIATGGSTGNVNLRRTFDPRLTEIYEHAGAVYSSQTGDGEIAAMLVGASLWATGNQTAGAHYAIAKTAHIGCRWGYSSLVIDPGSPLFHRAKATGLTVRDWRNVLCVNHRGERFWNEADDPQPFVNAALGYHGSEAELNGGGPIWAIFDAAAAQREGWTPAPPHVDPDGFFAAGETIGDLARNIANPHQAQPIAPERLVATVERYNRLADAGEDSDFGKPGPLHRIDRGPFYAAWATPILHDSLTGLRTDDRGQVIDLFGRPIPGLYCAGESQGGLALHGLGRCVLFGRLAGQAAAGPAF